MQRQILIIVTFSSAHHCKDAQFNLHEHTVQGPKRPSCIFPVPSVDGYVLVEHIMDLIMCSLAVSAVPPACRMQSALQAEEEFFVCKWSKNEQTGAPILLLAGQTGAIRVIDCHLREVAWVRKLEHPFTLMLATQQPQSCVLLRE